jgi:magnesium-transporting ATPase (P-type)
LIADALSRLHSNAGGLSEDEVTQRLRRYGPNRLTPPPPLSAARILIAQFKSIVVVLLLGAIAVSLATGDRLDAIAISAVLLINTAIGFVMELRARRAMEALLQFDVPSARVVRNGRLVVVSAHALVHRR